MDHLGHSFGGWQMKTPEELERLAYINGHTEIADLLGQVIDQSEEIHELQCEIEWLEDKK